MESIHASRMEAYAFFALAKVARPVSVRVIMNVAMAVLSLQSAYCLSTAQLAFQNWPVRNSLTHRYRAPVTEHTSPFVVALEPSTPSQNQAPSAPS